MAEQATGDISTPNQETEATDGSSKSIVDENAALNSAVTKQLKSVEKRLAAQFAEMIAQMSAPKEPEVKESKTSELAKLQQEVAALRNEKAAADKKARDITLRATVKDQLSQLGINTPAALKGASALLIDGERLVEYDGDEIGFKTADGFVSLADGLRQWSKSEDAKVYIPAKGTAGTGATHNYRSTNSPTPTNKADEALDAFINSK